MAKRSMFDIPTPHLPVEQVNDMITNFMRAEGFRVVQYKGQTVLKCGYGIWVAPQFLRVDVQPGMVHLEAWIRSFGEHPLEGFVGAIPKSLLQTKVNKLMAALSAPAMQQV